MITLDPLEQAVIQKILEGEHPILQGLRKQFETATVDAREVTGVGFHVHFSLPPATKPIATPPKLYGIGDVEATIPGLMHGAGFLLFAKHGKLLMLEGFSYDEPWPGKITTFQLRYLEPERTKFFEILNGR